MHNDLLISQTYITLFPRLVKYIGSRTGDMDSACDVAQDVFVKLLEADIVLFRKEALVSMALNIARNLIVEIFRRQIVDMKMREYLAITRTWTVDAESGLLARDIESLEIRKMETLSQQRKMIYRLRRFDGLTNEEIARRLGLTKRSVENHAFRAFHEMRDYLRKRI